MILEAQIFLCFWFLYTNFFSDFLFLVNSKTGFSGGTRGVYLNVSLVDLIEQFYGSNSVVRTPLSVINRNDSRVHFD